MTSSTQPLGNGSTSILTYGYFDNGLRSSLSINSPALNQSNLATYQYRGDGLQTSENFNGHQFAWTYSPGGRENSYQDPYFTANRSYNSTTGVLTSYDVAEGTYAGIAHDFEGSITSYAAYGQTVTLGYDSLGEFGGQTFAPGATDDSGNDLWPSTHQQYANGHADAIVCPGGLCNATESPFDFRNSVTLGTSATSGAPVTCGANISCSWSMSKRFTFDNAGRQSGGSSSWNSSYSCGGMRPYQCYASGSGTFTAHYDAENHLLGKARQSWPVCDSVTGGHAGSVSNPTSYVYGPAGHPIKMAGQTIYWDGDEILLTTNSSNQIRDFKVGLLADYGTGSGQEAIWDRDPADMVTASHNGTGHDAWLPPSPYHKCGGSTPPNAPANSPGFVGWSPIITSPGSDGYYDGDSVIQGVRAYDPQIQSWTAPDAYPGEVHDPMSQKAYMWNRNSPADYADPSGFCVPACAAAGVAAGAAVEIGIGDVLIMVGLGAAGTALTNNGKQIFSDMGAAAKTFLKGGGTGAAPKPQAGSSPGEVGSAEHTSPARPSTEEQHEQGQARKKRDAGGEKADKNQGGNRRPPRRRPPGWRGPYPPKTSTNTG